MISQPNNIILFERKIGFVLEHRKLVQGDVVFHDYLVFFNGEVAMIRESFHKLKNDGQMVSLGATRSDSSKWNSLLKAFKQTINKTRKKNG